MATVVVVLEVTILTPSGGVVAVCDSFQTAEKLLESNLTGHKIEETESVKQVNSGLLLKRYTVTGIKDMLVVFRNYVFQEMELKTS